MMERDWALDGGRSGLASKERGTTHTSRTNIPSDTLGMMVYIPYMKTAFDGENAPTEVCGGGGRAKGAGCGSHSPFTLGGVAASGGSELWCVCHGQRK